MLLGGMLLIMEQPSANIALIFVEKNRWKGLFKKPETKKNIINEVTGV